MVALYNSLHAGKVFFKINFFKKLFQERYQSAKQLGSRFCPSCSGTKLFAKTKLATDKQRVNIILCFCQICSNSVRSFHLD